MWEKTHPWKCKKRILSPYKEKKWKSKECVKTNWKICAIIFFVDLSLFLSVQASANSEW